MIKSWPTVTTEIMTPRISWFLFPEKKEKYRQANKPCIIVWILFPHFSNFSQNKKEIKRQHNKPNNLTFSCYHFLCPPPHFPSLFLLFERIWNFLLKSHNNICTTSEKEDPMDFFRLQYWFPIKQHTSTHESHKDNIHQNNVQRTSSWNRIINIHYLANQKQKKTLSVTIFICI